MLNHDWRMYPVTWTKKIKRDAVGAIVKPATDKSVPAPSASNHQQNEGSDKDYNGDANAHGVRSGLTNQS